MSSAEIRIDLGDWSRAETYKEAMKAENPAGLENKESAACTGVPCV